MRGGHNVIDMAGQIYGQLCVIQRAESESRKARWVCKCSCGKIVTIHGRSLRIGVSKSCGCLRGKQLSDRNNRHGLRFHRFYNVWNSMIHRCYNRKNPYYSDYGGRGIEVCEEWRHSAKNFLAWCDSLGDIPDGFSLDRYPDLNGPYSPTNCRFTSPAEQSRNTRSNVWVEYKGERLCFTDFCNKYGKVSLSVASKRVHRLGWDRISAVLTPPKQKRIFA